RSCDPRVVTRVRCRFPIPRHHPAGTELVPVPFKHPSHGGVQQPPIPTFHLRDLKNSFPKQGIVHRGILRGIPYRIPILPTCIQIALPFLCLGQIGKQLERQSNPSHPGGRSMTVTTLLRHKSSFHEASHIPPKSARDESCFIRALIGGQKR